MPVRSATLIQISGTRTPSRSRQAIMARLVAKRRRAAKPRREVGLRGSGVAGHDRAMGGSSSGARRDPAAVASAARPTRRVCALVGAPALALLAVAAAALAGGAGAQLRIATAEVTPIPSASPGPTAAAPHAALRVGTSGDYAPFSTVGPDEILTGFDVEVARAYARD